MIAENFSLKIQLGLKRLLDIIIGLFVLITFSPFLFIIAILIKRDSPGPVLYRHRRIGKDGHPFGLYKFRTMVCGGDDTSYMNYLRELIDSSNNKNESGRPYVKMHDDCRVTKVGHVLRKYYLDELPQMVNVIKGDLSLVGPRPHVQFEVDNYAPEQRRRLAVKPGATGLWQTVGKGDCTFCELIAYDLEYIDSWSLLLDLRIIFSTVYIMLRGGESFWTRADKKIPRRYSFGLPRNTDPKANIKLESPLPKNIKEKA
jgi:lipopolysaccharide/colanic/teichoic acid biosynthesis glycosyltransferase